MIRWPKGVDIQVRRARTGEGINEAKRALEREAMLRAAEQARTVDELREVVVAMLGRML